MHPNEALKPKHPEPGKPASSDEWYNRVKAQLEQNPAAEKAKAGEGKEKKENGLKKAWTAFGDMVRDIGTASEMAKEKFSSDSFSKDGDGDSAFKYAMRGVMTTAVGAGMEVAMDSLWNDIWQGKMPFIERFQIGSGVAENLNKLVTNDHSPYRWKTRLAYLMKEGSQDLAIATVYNMLMTWRAQQLFPKVKPEHLFVSLSVDAIEALLSQTLPTDMDRKTAESQNEINKKKFFDLDFQIGNLIKNGKLENRAEVDYGADDLRLPNFTTLNEDDKRYQRAFLIDVVKENKRVFAKTEVKVDQDNLREIMELLDKKNAVRKQINWDADEEFWKGQNPQDERPFHINEIEHVIRSMTNLSNPVSNLGIAMIGDSILTLKENYKKVHDERKRKGGLPGKKVFMPKPERKWEDKRHFENKDKVYYGKARWQEEKPQKLTDLTPEEELLEKFI